MVSSPYVCLSQQLTEQLRDLLAEDPASVRDRERCSFDRILAAVGGNLVLFGAGSLGQSSLRCLLRDGIRPLAFCDNNSALWDTSIEGIPVLSPACAAARYGASNAFFVTIWGLAHRYAETHDRLSAAGCRHVYPAAPLRWKYSGKLLPFFLQDLPHKVYREAPQVLAAFQLWADERSREEYAAQIRYRALGDFYGLSAPDREPSYFPDSLYSLGAGEVFVDCGAYDGDTIQELLRRRGECFSRIVALEPDPRNFAAIGRYLACLRPSVASRISALAYAASSRRCQVRFSASGDESATIAETGNIVINSAPLDELVSHLAPTFIKMDIEGSEADALQGARELIAKYHPILSICLYHRQSDLWRIPLLIHSIYPGYRYYLRAHEADGWQTVGYAVPPERLNPCARS
jgi:FkbM family methyltransferase